MREVRRVLRGLVGMTLALAACGDAPTEPELRLTPMVAAPAAVPTIRQLPAQDPAVAGIVAWLEQRHPGINVSAYRACQPADDPYSDGCEEGDTNYAPCDGEAIRLVAASIAAGVATTKVTDPLSALVA